MVGGRVGAGKVEGSEDSSSDTLPAQPDPPYGDQFCGLLPCCCCCCWGCCCCCCCCCCSILCRSCCIWSMICCEERGLPDGPKPGRTVEGVAGCCGSSASVSSSALLLGALLLAELDESAAPRAVSRIWRGAPCPWSPIIRML